MAAKWALLRPTSKWWVRGARGGWKSQHVYESISFAEGVCDWESHHRLMELLEVALFFVCVCACRVKKGGKKGG